MPLPLGLGKAKKSRTAKVVYKKKRVGGSLRKIASAGSANSTAANGLSFEPPVKPISSPAPIMSKTNTMRKPSSRTSDGNSTSPNAGFERRMKSWEKARQASVIKAKPRTSDGRFFVASKGLSENGERHLSPERNASIPKYTMSIKKNCVSKKAVVSEAFDIGYLLNLNVRRLSIYEQLTKSFGAPPLASALIQNP